MTKEPNSGLVGSTPELSLGKVKRIIESEKWVGLLGKNLEVSLGFVELS